VAEPVGVRWGKHQYRVPSLSHVKSLRSLEGSAAVFFASALMILLGIALSPHFNLNIVAVWKIPLLALLCAGVEAVSPHGWDNATMQIIPAFLATILL
jgi:phytol kinase